MRARFAPSPTGQLHVGNARTALFNWLFARGQGEETPGTFILRIEDTDAERSTRESEDAIAGDLRWLGLDWDEGPDAGGSHGPYRQSERLHLYQSYAKELLGAGSAYYCFCSTEQLEAERQAAVAEGRPVQYSGTCRNLSQEEVTGKIAAGGQPAIRFRVPEGTEIVFTDLVRGEVRFQNEVIGDPVIVRADGTPAYNFAVVVDDALMEVTHVIRGEDHLSNTPRQLLLYEALGFTPPQFAHLALVMGPDHSPLSKRHGATSIAEFRTKGYLPEALVNYLALIGWSPGDDVELMSIDELARHFSLERVGHSPGVFDEEKLAWVNRHYLKIADAARIAELSVPFFSAAGVPMTPDDRGRAFLTGAMSMITASVDRLNQVPTRLAFLFDYDATRTLTDAKVRAEMSGGGARAVAAALADELAAAPRLDRERFRAVANQVKARTGQKAKALFHPMRVALTGRTEGPELDLAVPAIDSGADLPRDAGIPPIIGNRERAQQFVDALNQCL
jgi:nondiscriminating glutamyl-tRNA synthetase